MNGVRVNITISGALDSATDSAESTMEVKGLLSLAFSALFQSSTFNQMDEAGQRRTIELSRCLSFTIDNIYVAKIEQKAERAGGLKSGRNSHE